MKLSYQTPLEALVCKRVKQLLNERNISVRQLANAIYKDHSQLNKILHQQAILPAYMIDDFAQFFQVDRNTLVIENNVTYQNSDSTHTINFSIQTSSYDVYKKMTKIIETIQK